MCGAPVAGHPLVRHPAEQQYADRFRLIDRQLLQLVAPHIFMPVDVPALWTLEEAVECHHIPHDECSHSKDTPPDSSLLETRSTTRPPDCQTCGRLDALHVPPKVAGAIAMVPVPAAARPRLELHR